MTKHEFFDVVQIITNSLDHPFKGPIAFRIGYLVARGAVDNWFNTTAFSFDDVKCAVEYQIERFDASGMNEADFKSGVDWFLWTANEAFKRELTQE